MTEEFTPDGHTVLRQPTHLCVICEQEKATDLRIGSTYTCIECLEKFYLWGVKQFQKDNPND